MAYTAVITTVAEMQLMAGVGVGASDTEAIHIILQDQAEAYLSALLQDDVVAGIGSYDATTKELLSEWASRYAGITMIMNNTVGYTDLIEAEDMVQVHVYRLEKIEALLLEGSAQKQLKVNT